jgi:hypothetical protein
MLTPRARAAFRAPLSHPHAGVANVGVAELSSKNPRRAGETPEVAQKELLLEDYASRRKLRRAEIYIRG